MPSHGIDFDADEAQRELEDTITRARSLARDLVAYHAERQRNGCAAAPRRRMARVYGRLDASFAELGLEEAE
jgi:hypothetical protein